MQATAFLNTDIKNLKTTVLLLVGEERELHRQVIAKLVADVLKGDDLALESLDANEDSTNKLLDTVATGGLFSPTRIIVYRNAENWQVMAKSAQLIELEKYVSSPDPNTWLVISAAQINKGRYPFKLLVKEAETIECPFLKGGELKAWVKAHLKESKITAPEAVLNYTLDQTGNDLTLIKNTFEKISIFMGDRSEMTREDVESCIATGREHAMWELTEAIGRRNVEQTLSVADKLINEGKHPLQIATTLQYQFKQLIAVRSLLQQRHSSQEIARELNIRFFIDRVINQSNTFSPKELIHAYQRLYTLEDSLKSGAADNRFILEKALYDICSAESK